MGTKIIPFDLETAKKIQAGEIEGKIKTRCGYAARILCTDLVQAQPVLAAFITHELESVSHYTKGGHFYINEKLNDLDLVLEVPDNEPQFKPFDKVLVRENNGQVWHCDFYSYTDSVHGMHYCVGHCGKQILPYEGNEHLVGTTDKPE